MDKLNTFMKGFIVAFALLVVGMTARADIRYISITNDLTTGVYQFDRIAWYQGESVTIDVTAKRGRNPVVLPEDGAVVFRVWRTNAPAILVVDVTGTVQNATSGVARVNLSTTQANVAPSGSNFFGEIGVWDTTNYFGVIASGPVIINYAAVGSNLAYVGTSDLLSTVLTNATVSGAGTVTGTVTRSGNQLSFLLDAIPGMATDAEVSAVATRLNTASNSLQSQIDTKLPTTTHATSTAAIWSAIGGIVSADNALTNIVAGTRLTFSKTNAQGYLSFNASGLATGTPIYSTAGLATGTPIYSVAGLATGTPLYAYTETDPVWSAASNRYVTTNGLATTLGGYVTTAALSSTLSGYATGTPIYTTAGLATGTPIYSVAGLATGTPIYSVAGLATGTPLYVETGTGTLVAASLTPYLTTSTAASTYATITSMNASNAAQDTAIAARMTGAAASNAFAPANVNYAVNEQSITGRWYAVENTVRGFDSWIGGGSVNTATGLSSSIAAGTGNRAYGNYSTVGAGHFNSVNGDYSTIGGGYGNLSANIYETIGGGSQNFANGPYSTIGGGLENATSGGYSAIPGGYNNTATTNAFAAGVGARATNSGSFVWSGPGDTNATFGSRGDNTFNVRAVGGSYFLSQGFYIADTNGNTIAAFTPTNSTLSGTLNLTGYVPTNGNAAGLTNFPATLATVSAVNAQVQGASNLAFAIGAGATNIALAVGAGATNLHIAQGVAVTNAQQTASNATAGVVAVGAVATNAQTVANAAVPWLSATSTVNGIVAATAITNLNSRVWTNTPRIQVGTNAPSSVALTYGAALTLPYMGAVNGYSSGIQLHYVSNSIVTNAFIAADASGNPRWWRNGNNGGVSGFQILHSGLATFQTESSARTNYLRYTSTYPTNYNAYGEWMQVATTTRDATSIWVAIYGVQSNEWYEAVFNRVTPK